MNNRTLAVLGTATATMVAVLSTPTSSAASALPTGQTAMVAADLAVSQFIVQRRTAFRPVYGAYPGYGAPVYGIPGAGVVVAPRQQYFGAPGYYVAPGYNYAAPAYGGYPYGGPVYNGYSPGFFGGNPYGGRGINIPFVGRGINIAF